MITRILIASIALISIAHGAIATENPDMTGRGGVPHSYGSGSRVKPDRPVLTKSADWYEVYAVQTDDSLKFVGTFDRNGAAATADRLRLDGYPALCLSSDYPNNYGSCPTNF